MNKSLRAAVMALLVPGLVACSVHRAANQPPKKDLSLVKAGIPRDLVIAELGGPIASEETPEGRKEIYQFIQGYSAGNRTGRAVFHGAADLFTLGLWEIVGTPIEGNYNGKKMTMRIIYDEHDNVKSAETIAVSDPD